MIAAVGEVFYVSGPRDWPVAARTAIVIVLGGGVLGAVWLVLRGEPVPLAGGVALGAASAGALAAFLRSLRRLRWYVLDPGEVRAHDGRALAYAEIDRLGAEDVRGRRILVLHSPRADLRVPLFRGGRDLLVNVPLFVATLEERLKKPRGSIARLAKGEPGP